jgi:hypothetical protein
MILHVSGVSLMSSEDKNGLGWRECDKIKEPFHRGRMRMRSRHRIKEDREGGGHTDKPKGRPCVHIVLNVMY